MPVVQPPANCPGVENCAPALALRGRLTEEDMNELRGAVRDGIREGIVAAAKDDELVKRFWHSGFEHLAGHAGKAGSQWIGQRIATAMIVAIVSAGVAWLVKNGKI